MIWVYHGLIAHLVIRLIIDAAKNAIYRIRRSTTPPRIPGGG